MTLGSNPYYDPPVAIRIERVANGWIVYSKPNPSSYADASSIKVARSPDQLLVLVGDWANQQHNDSSAFTGDSK